MLEKLVRFKLRYLPLGLVALALAWVAAPALSSQPYMPGAVDFEQALTGVQPAGDLPDRQARAFCQEGGQRAGQLPLRRARRAGALRPRRARRRAAAAASSAPATPDGEWSEWVEADDGNPVYFGGADELQLRARGWRPRRDAPLRQRLGNDEHGRRAADRCARGDQLGLHLGDRRCCSRPRRRRRPGRRSSPAPSGARAWPRAGARRAIAPSYGRGQGRRDPPHRDRERLLRGGGARGSCSGSAAITATPTAGTTSATRPSSTASATSIGPRRRDEEGRRRRPGPGVQRADHRDRLDRHPHEGGTDGGRA